MKSNAKQNREAKRMGTDWETDIRWHGVQRPYKPEDVLKLRGTINIEYTLAKHGARRLWKLLNSEPYVNALGAVTGNQAIQMVQAGLKAIYLSGWQVAADANHSYNVYPDQSLYPADSAPALARRINNALQREDQIWHAEGRNGIYWFAPIVADAEAGFGGNLNVYELMKAMIEAGVAGVHYEDQLPAAKKCGHMNGKVLVPDQVFIQKLVAARLAADVMGIPTIIIARTDANRATLLQGNHTEIDERYLTGETTPEGFKGIRGGLELAIERSLRYAPFADMLWCETSTPDLGAAKEFAAAIKGKYPNKMLAYNCSPSFNWKRNLSDKAIAHFQTRLAEMGYKFQFVTLAGFHALNTSMYELALAYKERGMSAYAQLQEHEFKLEHDKGYRAVRHQSFVGAGYFEQVQLTVQGLSSTTSFKSSPEEDQFRKEVREAVEAAL